MVLSAVSDQQSAEQIGMMTFLLNPEPWLLSSGNG